MKLIQTSILSSFSIAVKVLTGFLVMKFAALYLGATGIGITGQLLTLINILAVAGGGGISLGVIKYVAEYKNDTVQLESFLSTSFLYALSFALAVMLVSLIFSNEISLLLFDTQKYSYVIAIISVVQILISFNLLTNATFNGMREIKTLTLINICSAFLSCLFTVISVIYFGLMGALVALSLAQIFPFVVSLFFIMKRKWKKYFFSRKYDKAKAHHLFRYSIMTLVSALSFPVAQIFIRHDMADLFSWEDVGYWQAVIRISDAYLLLAGTILSAYYLPKLSELSEKQSIKLEIFSSAKLICPAFFLILLMIYLFRDPIVLLLYTQALMPATDLFLWQLAGDLIRICGLMCTYLLLAKSYSKIYVSAEIFLAASFIFFAYHFMRLFGLIGATYAFFLASLLYTSMMLLVFFWYFKPKKYNLANGLQ